MSDYVVHLVPGSIYLTAYSISSLALFMSAIDEAINEAFDGAFDGAIFLSAPWRNGSSPGQTTCYLTFSEETSG